MVTELVPSKGDNGEFASCLSHSFSWLLAILAVLGCRSLPSFSNGVLHGTYYPEENFEWNQLLDDSVFLPFILVRWGICIGLALDLYQTFLWLHSAQASFAIITVWTEVLPLQSLTLPLPQTTHIPLTNWRGFGIEPISASNPISFHYHWAKGYTRLGDTALKFWLEGVEAFIHNSIGGSFAPLVPQPSTNTKCLYLQLPLLQSWVTVATTHH